MRSPPLWNALAIGLLIPAALSCAGKAPPDPVAELRGGIDEIVADEARAARMQVALGEIASAIAEADSLFVEERAALIPLVRKHRSSRQEIEQSLALFNARHESASRRFLVAHAALKAEATPAEWEELRDLELSVIQLAGSKSSGTAAPPEQKEGSRP